MRYLVLLALAVAGCSKTTPPSKARASFNKAVDIFNEINAGNPHYFKLEKEVKAAALAGDEAKRKAVEKEWGALVQERNKRQKDFREALEQAVAAADDALSRNPKDVDALDIRSTVRDLRGEFDESQADVEKLLKLSPDDPRYAARGATALRSKGKYAEARALLKPLLEKNPDHPMLLAEDGVCASCLNDYETGLARLEAASKNMKAMTGRLLFELSSYLAGAKDYVEWWKAETLLRDAETKADNLPRLRLETSRGVIVVELFENEAPNTVANFIDLADRQFFDGTKFHRVIPDFMVQGGDPNSRNDDPKDDGKGGPGYAIADELPEGKFRRHFRGSLAMANSGPDTNGSQFYIAARPTGHLDGKHTVFGRVLDGMDVVDKTEQGDTLLSVTILRKRDHPYRPVLKE
jgi:peptidyl-prolyl cis-trans isomerase B (cyclophilin B)